MKKGDAMFGFIVAAVIILAFAAVFIYAFAPKLQKAPGFVEGFFPEKCALSGKTRDQYFSEITNAVSSLPPNTIKALQLNTEMKTCFSDAELPGDESKFIQGTAKAEISKLKDATTNKEFKTVLDIYDNSKSVIPLSDWTPEDLLLFSKALFYSQGLDANKIIDLLLARKDATPAQTAEALTIKASLLQQEGRNTDALNLFRQVIAKYQNKADDKEFSPFVGRALYVVGNEDKNEELKKNALVVLYPKFPTFSQYNYDYAALYFSMAYFNAAKEQQKGFTFADAAKSFEDFLLNPSNAQDSVFYKDAVTAYSQIDNNIKTIKDCSINEISASQCVCNGIITSAKSCICKGGCGLYNTGNNKAELCNNDPCNFRQDYGDSVAYCRWLDFENTCKYYQSE